MPGLVAIDKRLEQLSSIEQRQAEILRKLDQVLNNQAAILKELEIVKVRASRN
jgi:hypothetical protein